MYRTHHNVPPRAAAPSLTTPSAPHHPPTHIIYGVPGRAGAQQQPRDVVEAGCSGAVQRRHPPDLQPAGRVAARDAWVQVAAATPLACPARSNRAHTRTTNTAVGGAWGLSRACRQGQLWCPSPFPAAPLPAPPPHPLAPPCTKLRRHIRHTTTISSSSLGRIAIVCRARGHESHRGP